MAQTTRRDFLKTMSLAAAGLLVPGLPTSGFAQEGGRQPNVLFILADDLGWVDTSLYGSKFYQTPNINALAKRGMMFTNAYAAAPLCSATRASIMTGCWPGRLGIVGAGCHLQKTNLEMGLSQTGPAWHKARGIVEATRLNLEYNTLAESFKAAGYRTGHFGKWHLGLEPYDPLHQGFDVDVPHWWGPGLAGSYVAPWQFPPTVKFDPETPNEHLEDRMAREAVKFIKENKDRPFFLNYWAFSVHVPLDAKQELIEKYHTLADPDNPQRNPVMGAMIESLDDAVGTLTRTLEEEGLLDNTILVYTSDNGGWMRIVNGQAKGEFADLPATSNAPLRDGKATLYEGGTRVPLVVIWPDHVKPGTKNETAIVQSIDFYPTLMEMTGAKAQPGQKFDGVSFVRSLTGGAFKRDTLFWHFPLYTPATGQIPATSVRQGDWKLIRFYCDGPEMKDRYELYNLKDDIGEKTDLAAKLPEKVAALSALIDGFLKDSGAVVPQPNPKFDPQATMPQAGGPPKNTSNAKKQAGGQRVMLNAETKPK